MKVLECRDIPPPQKYQSQYDKIVKTDVVVRLTVQGIIKHGDERAGNHHTTYSGGLMKITKLKDRKRERHVFLDPRLLLWKKSSRANIELGASAVDKPPLSQNSMLSLWEKGILVDRAAGQA
jgi:hypothetical protein